VIERILIFFLASLFIASAAWGQQLAPPKERPNILMIVADDMNWDTPGCFGGAAPDVTPHLDKLASEGMRFKNAISESFAKDFIDCVKSQKRPARDLEPVGRPASVLYYAGNISRQSGRTLTLDPNTETFIDDPEANRLRGRTEWPKPDILAKV